MATLSIRQLTVRLGGRNILESLDLEVAEGEFLVLLGPSGCGKSTLLHAIAGLQPVAGGQLLIDGTDHTASEPAARNIGMVFQSYALYPNMDVAGNLGFGLRARGLPAAQVAERVQKAAAMLQLESLLARKPAQLSGGQRQRVALARALVNEPKVLLLDEPLGALDLKLREEMQIELKAIQHAVGITFIYVTHDQEEALTMSDRIAVFNKGRIEQVGSPAEVYERPVTEFVAGFVGTSNLLRGEVAERVFGASGTFTVRPEKIRLADPGSTVASDEIGVDGRIREVVYLGSDTRYHVALDAGSELVVTQQNLVTSSMEALAAEGRPTRLIWKRIHSLPISA